MDLIFDHVFFGFQNRILLTDVSFEIHSSGIHTLIGGNGSGKTTLFNLIGGFYRPQQGRITLAGRRIDGLPPYQVSRRGIARSFQDLRLISRLSVWQNVLLAMKDDPTSTWYRGIWPRLYRRERQMLFDKADAILRRCFLTSLRDQAAGNISYGEQKLLNIACCIAGEAELILLDEPLAGINPEYRQRVGEILLSLKEEGKTIFMIEHHKDSIEWLSDDIFFLSNGTLAKFSHYAGLRQDPAVLASYL